jgi:membrane protein YdbS with pleckstrin-like domain
MIAMTTSAGPFDPDDVTWTSVSVRLAHARLTVTVAVAVIGFAVTVPAALLIGAGWGWVFPAIVAAGTLWAALLIGRQVRAISYAERVDDLLIRKGILFRSMVVVPYGRMQYVNVTAGPLARRFRIASVQLHTAAVGTNATIDGLPPEEATRLRDRLASRGEARLAGL